MSKKYEDRFATYWDRLFTDDAETRKEERALYIDVKVLDNADRFPRAYRGTGLFEKMNEQDDPVEEVYSRGRHTTRATRRKQTFHARNRAKEVVSIRKAKERKVWGELCRHPWKPIKKQTHKRDKRVRYVEEDYSIPKFDYYDYVQKSYEDPDYKIEPWEYEDLFYENQQQWENVYIVEQRKRIASNIRTLQIEKSIPPVTFLDIALY